MHKLASAIVAVLLSGLPALGVVCASVCASGAIVAVDPPNDTAHAMHAAASHHGHHGAPPSPPVSTDEVRPHATASHHGEGSAAVGVPATCACEMAAVVPATVSGQRPFSGAGPSIDGALVPSLRVSAVRASLGPSGGPPGPSPGSLVPATRFAILRI